MQVEEFLKRIRLRAGVSDNEQALRYTRAVFDTLRARISHSGGDNVAAQLPQDLKRVWESGTLDHLLRSISGVERMDLGAFLARVADELDLDSVERAQQVTAAVFMTMQEQITPGARHSIESQLPDDIREFWQESAPAEEAAVREAPTAGAGSEAPTAEEEAGARPWGPEMDVPTGSDVEKTQAPTESQPRETKARPPAEAREEMEAPAEARKGQTGPGGETFYRGDPDLTREIEALLDANDEVDSGEIDVVVQAGNVTLHGRVPDHHQKEVAGRVAASALGVGAIRNELDVKGS